MRGWKVERETEKKIAKRERERMNARWDRGGKE
jgi:hypothetical protein